MIRTGGPADTQARVSPAEVTATEAARAAAESGALLLDVREPAEWRAGHAPQARHLPLGQLETGLADLPTDRLIMAVCRSGRRSATAADLLTGRGHPTANVTGGMTAWVAAGLPVITDDGGPGRVA